MRRAFLPLAAALTGVLLLGACGPLETGAPGSGPARRQGSACRDADAPSGAPASPASPGESTGADGDGVRAVVVDGCPAFEVTNEAAQSFTYTITYQVLTTGGVARAGTEKAVATVGPGGTVRRTVDPGASATGTDGGARLKIVKVRSVPAAEAPAGTGPCPTPGVRVYADDGDAAMGLRVVGLHLANCGTRAYRLDGYPAVRLLDERHTAVTGVRILHGGASIATGTGADAAPRPLVLEPGESARAALVWRNTTGLGSEPVHAPYVRVVAKPGAAAVTVTPELDLGTTGKLGVGAWQKDEASRAAR
ncbi:DUF4232 domain-containing protein [Streptomyces sp. NRRL S-340]|uniref:DUF4232 domain-containing protein n=1 Tax=Streptomyces sp. NRRL S-340 TaxID=1463901 RepID=UPI000566FA83|nr:DUF4232 domain-containing protein [Streptomyces sp. NRRL S-340]